MSTKPCGITVSDIMTKNVVSIDAPTMSAKDAAEIMTDCNIGSLVITEDNLPIGILTDRDLMTKIVSKGRLPTTSVRDIMSSPLIAAPPDETVMMIVDLMYTRNIRKVPIIDKHVVKGIVTTKDIVTQFITCNEDDIREMYYKSITKLYPPYTPKIS